MNEDKSIKDILEKIESKIESPEKTDPRDYDTVMSTTTTSHSFHARPTSTTSGVKGEKNDQNDRVASPEKRL